MPGISIKIHPLNLSSGRKFDWNHRDYEILSTYFFEGYRGVPTLGKVTNAWSADGKTLFAGWHHQSDSALLRIALDGTVSVLIRSNNPQIPGAVPSPNGRFLLIAETSTARNVWQIENF